MNPYWFEITGKIYAENREHAEELIYRYTLGAYKGMKIKTHEVGEEGEE